MKQCIISLASSFASLIILDVLWFLWMGKSFYRFHLDHLMAFSINFFAAWVAYFICAFGITLLVVLPHQHSLLKVFFYGLILGFVVYGSYNFTNHAILNDWPLFVVGIDTLWGTCACGIASISAVLMLKFFNFFSN